MPSSHPEGRDWATKHIADTTAPVIVDIGPGDGTYSDLARGHRPDAHWIGVEIWEPYIQTYDLETKYDEIIVADARTYRFPDQPFILLCGDVIEHMPYDDATLFLAAARAAADEIMVACPIIDYPQHEVDGNPHEAHLYNWGFDEMAEQLPGCDTWRGEVIGRYWWKHP